MWQKREIVHNEQPLSATMFSKAVGFTEREKFRSSLCQALFPIAYFRFPGNRMSILKMAYVSKCIDPENLFTIDLGMLGSTFVAFTGIVDQDNPAQSIGFDFLSITVHLIFFNISKYVLFCFRWYDQLIERSVDIYDYRSIDRTISQSICRTNDDEKISRKIRLKHLSEDIK